MPNRNHMVVIGHLGKDVEIRYTANSTPIASLVVAATDKWMDKKTKEWKEATEWVKASIYGELAEYVGEEFAKGSAIHLEGKITTKKWTDKNGVDKYSTEMNANYVAKPVYVKKAPSGLNKHGMSDDADDVPF